MSPRSLSAALSAAALVGCVSTTLEVSQHDPANPDAPGAPPAETRRALAAGFDPFEGEASPAAGTGHEGHAGHGAAPPPEKPRVNGDGGAHDPAGHGGKQ